MLQQAIRAEGLVAVRLPPLIIHAPSLPCLHLHVLGHIRAWLPHAVFLVEFLLYLPIFSMHVIADRHVWGYRCFGRGSTQPPGNTTGVETLINLFETLINLFETLSNL